MDKLSVTLTVLFEAPFWIGLYQTEEDGECRICKITFGSEPKDYQIYVLLLRERFKLVFDPSVKTAQIQEKRINPKRMQRDIEKQMLDKGVGTKAQQAIKLQQEQGKLERKTRSREQREAEAQRQFELKQEKRREKHKGH